MAKVLVETSARHLHLTQEDLETLFGKGFELTFKKALSQPWKFKEYLSIFSSYCSTDLSLGNLLWLADSAKNLDTDKIQSETLPGNGEVTCKNVKYCYQLYVDDTVDIVNRLVNPYLTERTKQNLNIFTVE